MFICIDNSLGVCLNSTKNIWYIQKYVFVMHSFSYFFFLDYEIDYASLSLGYHVLVLYFQVS